MKQMHALHDPRDTLARPSVHLYAAPYVNQIRLSVRKMTRRELRGLMTIRHGQRIPNDANLRDYVSKFHAHQQAINGGAVPSDFWRSAVGLPNRCQ